MNNLIKLDSAYAVCFCNGNDAQQGVSAIKVIAWAVMLDILMHAMSIAFMLLAISLAIVAVMGGPSLWKTQTPKDIDAEVVS